MRDDYNNSNSSLLTFAMGAVTAIAAIMFLDKDMRSKVENKLQDAKSYGNDQVEKAKTMAMDAKNKVEDKAQEKLSDVNEKLDDHIAERDDMAKGKSPKGRS